MYPVYVCNRLSRTRADTCSFVNKLKLEDIMGVGDNGGRRREVWRGGENMIYY